MSDKWKRLSEIIYEDRDTGKSVNLRIDTRDLHCIREEVEEVEGKYPVNEILEVLYTKKWVWWKNSRCKYLRLKVNTATKMCLIFDRKGTEITMEEFKHQAGGSNAYRSGKGFSDGNV